MKNTFLKPELNNKVKKLIIDTNGYLRLFINDIPEQADIIEKLLIQAKKSIIEVLLPQIIVFEIHFALEKYYHFNKNEVIEKLESLVSTDYIQVESRKTFIEAINIYKNSNTSFVDCFLFSKKILEKADLFTFDKKLKKIQEI